MSPIIASAFPVKHASVPLPGLAAGLLILTAQVHAAVPAEPVEPHFDVLEYDVSGNTQLSDIEIERAVTPFLGEDKTPARRRGRARGARNGVSATPAT